MVQSDPKIKERVADSFTSRISKGGGTWLGPANEIETGRESERGTWSCGVHDAECEIRRGMAWEERGRRGGEGKAFGSWTGAVSM